MAERVLAGSRMLRQSGDGDARLPRATRRATMCGPSHLPARSTRPRPVTTASPAYMNSILVAERSTTLTHLLARTLKAAHFASWVEAQSYTDALAQLQEAERRAQPFRILLLGTPQRPTREFAELLNWLRMPRSQTVPVVVLGHDKPAELDPWLAGR